MPEVIGKLRAQLAGRYAIEREIGRGGMATVYRARDTQHDRSVALKVLHPELAASLGSERFQREIRLAARLQHPHILGVFDSGDTDGLLWFAMPFVEGESLRDRLMRERQLPMADALRIAREVALALDFAHRQGVIHRDIKPENILLADGLAMVADFGIARALGAQDESLTVTGTVIGTPAYMSPEQATGDVALDARSDVYSLACVLYELLAGEPPFSGSTPQAAIARLLTEKPTPLDTLRPSVPRALAEVVAQALGKTPADRPATAAEFARLLESAAPISGTHPAAAAPAPTGRPAWRRWSAVAALTAVLAGGAGLGIALSRGGNAAGVERRIAVLPFENAGSTEDEYFADGMTDEVRSRLSTIPSLRVTARGSSSQYKRSTKTPGEIGRELDVQYLLAGTVRWMKGNDVDRVRVTPELIDVARSETRWSQPYDTVLSDVFAVQASIASQVAQALDVALADTARARLAVAPASNLSAYDEFLKGEQITNSLGNADVIALTRGLQHYERALQLDSTFVRAWSAASRALSTINSVSPTTEGVERARVAAGRTMQLAPDHAETRLAMGEYLRLIPLDFAGAREQFLEGLRHDPNNADLLTSLATVERSLGEFDSVLSDAKRAAALDPRSVASARRLAIAFHDVRRYPEEIAAWNRALVLAPENLANIQGKAFAWAALGQIDSVHAMVQAVLRTSTVDTTALLVRFALYQEMMWALPPGLWPKILKLTVADFGGDKGHWGLKLGHTYRLLGDTARARMFGDTARLAFEEQLRAFPERAQLRELHGRALALGGHRQEAIEEAEGSLAMRETTLDQAIRPYVHFQVARILIQSGEYGRALELIEPLLTAPASDLTPEYLRLDPTFAPLQDDPRFQRLLRTRPRPPIT